MVRKLSILLACFAVTFFSVAADFRFYSPFSVDDFEEGPSNVIASAISSNLELVPSTNLVVTGTGVNRLLTVTPKTGIYGETLITVQLRDTGRSILRSSEMQVTPGVNAINVFTNQFPLISTNRTFSGQARVEFFWQDTSLRRTNSPFFIHRSLVPLSQNPDSPARIFKTVGTTTGTNFTDTNVIIGTNYYYFITYWVTDAGYDIQTNNYSFTLKVPPEVRLVFVGDGWGFEGKAGKTYQIMTKNNITNELHWEPIFDVNITSDQFYIFRGQEYLNKPIHVRELD